MGGCGEVTGRIAAIHHKGFTTACKTGVCLPASPCSQTLLFFAGCLIRFDQIPNYWKWYSYIDVLR